MPTFQEVRKALLKQAKKPDHFNFSWDSPYRKFWEKINQAEFDRGYDHDTYTKPGTPALCEMELLTPKELKAWLKELKKLAE